ncbi:MAG: hypothetical protein RIR43_1200 [Pseudomonadota bacterium]|jgi:hypothetical protein
MSLRLRSALLGLIAMALAMLAFVAYLRPGFVVALANQIWLCF